MGITFETDLQKLVPAFLRENTRFLDFLAEVGKLFDELKAKIDGLSEFNVDEIDEEYMQHLADRLGYEIKRSGAGLTYTEAELRRFLKAIPTLFSLKTTKQGFEALVWYYYGVSIISVLELWTKDYTTFKPYLSPGEAATENDGEYYVSPHIAFTFPSTIYTTLGALVGGGYQEGKTVFEETWSRINEFRSAFAVFIWMIENVMGTMGTLTSAPWGAPCAMTEFSASRSWS